MSIKAAIRELGGKRIGGVVFNDIPRGGPRHQVFLVFTDGSYYELYGEMHLEWSAGHEEEKPASEGSGLGPSRDDDG